MAEVLKTDKWHFFIGDARNPGRHDVVDHVLCFFMNPKLSERLDDPLDVTIVVGQVTCPECLEWLHA